MSCAPLCPKLCVRDQDSCSQYTLSCSDDYSRPASRVARSRTLWTGAGHRGGTDTEVLRRLDDSIRAAREIGIRFHPTRGAMTLGQSKGGQPPDVVCEEEGAVLKDMARVIAEFHDNSRCASTDGALQTSEHILLRTTCHWFP